MYSWKLLHNNIQEMIDHIGKWSYSSGHKSPQLSNWNYKKVIDY